MKLTITPNFEKDFISKNVEAFLKNLETAVLMRLQRIGEAFVIAARTQANFADRTGNLRSSIGYVVLRNGLAYSGGDFVPVKQAAEGAAIGKRVLSRIAKEYPQGWVLVGIAGMSYSLYVEAKGYSVITPFAIEAKAALEKAVRELNQKVG